MSIPKVAQNNLNLHFNYFLKNLILNEASHRLK